MIIIDQWLLLVDDECASCNHAKAIKITLDERGYNVVITCNCPECIFRDEVKGWALPIIKKIKAIEIIEIIANKLRNKKEGE